MVRRDHPRLAPGEEKENLWMIHKLYYESYKSILGDGTDAWEG